jgi:phosphoribosylaminoimidazole-succinocarboxamide synthase
VGEQRIHFNIDLTTSTLEIIPVEVIFSNVVHGESIYSNFCDGN